jgi:hypothetical protein
MSRHRREEETAYLIEFVYLGNTVKVSAVDPVTGKEACVVGDPAAGEAALSRLAIRKLLYAMGKKKPGNS